METFSFNEKLIADENPDKCDTLSPINLWKIQHFHILSGKTNPDPHLPLYSEVLTRMPEYGIKMEDLDLLQLDLEMLLSRCVVRQRLFLSETKPINGHSKIRKNQGNKYQQKQQHLINKLAKEKTVMPKVLYQPMTVPRNLFFEQEMPTINVFRNNVAESFWLSIEPYFATVTGSDLNFLDCLIQKSMKDIYVKNSCAQNRLCAICPRTRQCFGNQKPSNSIRSSAFHKRIPVNPTEVLSGTKIRARDLWLDYEQCVKELKIIRKRNLLALHQLRTAVKKKMSVQLKKAAKQTI